MNRSIIFLRTNENNILHTKERNYSLARKSKKHHYPNLTKNDIVHHKTFWKTVKPSLSNNVIARDEIKLSGNGEIVKT